MTVGITDIICIVSIVQLLIFAFFLITRKTKSQSNRILGLFLFAQAIGSSRAILYPRIAAIAHLHPYFLAITYPFPFLWAPSLYLYVKSLVSNDFRVRRIDLFHFVPFACGLLWSLVSAGVWAAGGERSAWVTQSSVWIAANRVTVWVVFVQLIGYNSLSWIQLRRYRTQLKEKYSSASSVNLSWLSFLIVGYLAASGLTILVQIIYMARLGDVAVMNGILFAVFFVYYNVIFYHGWKQPELFASVEEFGKYKYSKLTKNEAECAIDKLREYMHTRKPYLNPDLSLTQLAAALDIPARTLSQIINEYFKQNFYDYINTLRIEESKELLRDPAVKKTVLEVLYEVGFNSKSAFNAAFKKSTNLTPTEFRKQRPDVGEEA